MAKNTKRSSSRKMKRTHKRRSHTHMRKRSLRRSRRSGGAAPVNYHLSGSWPSRMSLGQGADYFKYHEGQHGGASLGMGAYPSAVLSPGLPDALRGPAHIGGIDKAIADVRGLCDPPNCPGTTTGGRRKSMRNRNKFCGGNRRNRTRRNRRYKRGGKSSIEAGDCVTLTPCSSDTSNKEKFFPAAIPVPLPSAASNNDNPSDPSNKKNFIPAAIPVPLRSAPLPSAPLPSAPEGNLLGGRNRRNRRRGGALGYAPFPSQGMLLSSSTQYAQAGLNPEWKTDVAFTDAKIRDMQ